MSKTLRARSIADAMLDARATVVIDSDKVPALYRWSDGGEIFHQATCTNMESKIKQRSKHLQPVNSNYGAPACLFQFISYTLLLTHHIQAPESSFHIRSCSHILQRDPNPKDKSVYKILPVSENCMKKIKLQSITETDWKHVVNEVGGQGKETFGVESLLICEGDIWAGT